MQKGGCTSLSPPPNSWANSEDSDIAVLYIKILPGGTMQLPRARNGADINRALYFVEGESVSVGSELVTSKSAIILRADMITDITNTNSSQIVELLLLQGRPINEPVAQQGPFVMNTEAEIQQAFADYRRTQFGGWPWPENAMVFPKEKGRFSLQDNVEETPPS